MREARLPGDGPLRLVERLTLDHVDELLELALGDRLVGLLAFLAVGRREALDQLAGDADDDLGRAEPGHLLGFLERDGAVVDDRGDVGHGPRLHVGEALALAADTPDGAVAIGIDVEDERLRELRPDVERRARSEGLVAVALPDPTPERHQASVPRRVVSAASASGRPSRRVPRPWAMAGRPPPRPSMAGIAAVTRSPAEIPVAARSSETVTKSCGSSASRARATTPDPSARLTSRAAALSAVHRVVRERGRDQADTGPDLGRVGDERCGLRDAGRSAGLEPALRLAELVLQGRDAIGGVFEASCADRGRGGFERVRAFPQVGVGASARQGFDAAHPGADTALAGDDEPADLPGGAAVGPAAQFEAVVLDADRAHGLPVLLVEEGVGPARDGVRHRHERDGDGPIVADDAADLVLDGPQLVGREAAFQWEVEAQVVRRHERAGLARAVTDDVPQGSVEQVRPGVVTHRVGATIRVHLRGHGLPQPKATVERAAMDDQSAERPLRVGHGEQVAAATGFAQDTEVADLAAAFGVERRAVEDHLRFAVAGQLVEFQAVADDPDDPAFGVCRVVAQELAVAGPSVDGAVQGREAGGLRELGLGPGSASVALLGQGTVEPGSVDSDTVLGGELDGQVDRESHRCRADGTRGRRRRRGRPRPGPRGGDRRLEAHR